MSTRVFILATSQDEAYQVLRWAKTQSLGIGLFVAKPFTPFFLHSPLAVRLHRPVRGEIAVFADDWATRHNDSREILRGMLLESGLVFLYAPAFLDLPVSLLETDVRTWLG